MATLNRRIGLKGAISRLKSGKWQKAILWVKEGGSDEALERIESFLSHRKLNRGIVVKHARDWDKCKPLLEPFRVDLLLLALDLCSWSFLVVKPCITPFSFFAKAI